MALADVFAVVGLMVFLGLAFPSLVVLTSLTMQSGVGRATSRVSSRPIRTTCLGALVAVASFVAVVIAANAPGPGKLLGLAGLLYATSLASIGYAGIVRHLADAYRREQGRPLPGGELFAATVLLELAIAVPLLGWFVVWPVSLLMALGAGMPSIALSRPVSEPAPQSTGSRE